MRKPKIPVPDGDDDWKSPIDRPDIITQVRSYKLITPLYGGGVKAGVVDEHTPIRGSAIRGHLRFWWRATRGGQFNGDLAEMKKKEDEIWGSASTPSQVSIAITKSTSGEAVSTVTFKDKKGKEKKVDYTDPDSPFAYVAFPLRDSKGVVRQGITFSMKITFKEKVAQDVEAALWAWETFGGIGARTRRGFGALHCVSNNDAPQPDPKLVKKWLNERLEKHVVDGNWPENVPHLKKVGQRYKVVQQIFKQPVDAWKKLIKQLRLFRQARDGEYGPSLWPEPNAIRKIMQDRIVEDNLYIGKIFPRAKFGLPIIFHFSHKGEPSDSTLKGKGKQDRLATPLILRPLVCQDASVGIGMLLEAPTMPLDGLYLDFEDGTQKISKKVDADLEIEQVKKISPLNNKTDILQAFLDSL